MPLPERKSQSAVVNLTLVAGMPFALDHMRFQFEVFVAAGLQGLHELLHGSGQAYIAANCQEQPCWQFLARALSFLLKTRIVVARHRWAGCNLGGEKMLNR